MRYLPGLLILLLGPGLSAQPATLLDDVLTLPAIISGQQRFHAELQLTDSAGDPHFSLLGTSTLATASGLGASYYRDGHIFIPHLQVDNQSYWARLRLTDEGNFRIDSYGVFNLGLDSNPIGVQRQPVWQRVDGDASDIGIGADGSVWVLGLDNRGGGYGIYYLQDHLQGNLWQRVEGGAVRIDVGPDGTPWIVNNDNDIYRRENGQWRRMPGSATDVGIGANGAVWIASRGGIYQWNGQAWDRIIGAGARIDVDPRGVPWVVGYSGEIFELQDGQWLRRPGEARDIGIGANGSVWITGTRDWQGGHHIYRWNGSDWSRVEGNGRQISVGPDGTPWVGAAEGQIYRAR